MDVNKWSSIGSRLCFAAALVLFVVGIGDYALALVGIKIWIGYVPGRLIEFGVMFLVPVITVLLREIRDELRKGKQA
jgi:hypothetical protein